MVNRSVLHDMQIWQFAACSIGEKIAYYVSNHIRGVGEVHNFYGETIRFLGILNEQ